MEIGERARKTELAAEPRDEAETREGERWRKRDGPREKIAVPSECDPAREISLHRERECVERESRNGFLWKGKEKGGSEGVRSKGEEEKGEREQRLVYAEDRAVVWERGGWQGKRGRITATPASAEPS